jgi:integrase
VAQSGQQGAPGLSVDGRSFHSFRHSSAARALEAGASIFWLSRQLGHSSTQVTTEKYGHFEKRARRAEAHKLAGAFGAL